MSLERPNYSGPTALDEAKFELLGRHCLKPEDVAKLYNKTAYFTANLVARALDCPDYGSSYLAFVNDLSENPALDILELQTFIYTTSNHFHLMTLGLRPEG